MTEISFAGAFLGGVLSLFSPCSSLLLPAFFAYAFQSRRALVGRTLVFLLGLCTLLIPLGMGSALAANLLLGQRDRLVLAAGILLILFGVLELSGRRFGLLPQRLAAAGAQGGTSWAAVYTTGLISGFGGFCAGPLLGSVLTVAAGSGSPVLGAALLFAYGVGMVLPLFIMAALWDRYRLGEKGWLRGRELRLGPWRIHSVSLVTGLLFVGLGLFFIATGGTVRLEGVYEALGLTGLSFELEEWIGNLVGSVPDWLWLTALAVLAGVILRVRQNRRGG